MKSDSIIVLFLANIISIWFVCFSASWKCELPRGCHLKLWDILDQRTADQIFTTSERLSVQCVIEKSEYRFDLESFLKVNLSDQCYWVDFDQIIELRFSNRRNIVLGPQLNLQGIIDFMLMNYYEIYFRFTNLNGFELDLNIVLDPITSNYLQSARYVLEFINDRFEFYTKGRLITSCTDMADLNETKSIFQLKAHDFKSNVYLINCEFKRLLCPLIFKHARIHKIYYFGAFDYYFKQNFLSFSNHTFENNLDVKIFGVSFLKCENIAVNSRLLHPQVFKDMESLKIHQGYREIQHDVFAPFKSLKLVQLEANFWKPLVHKQGIKWISSIKPFLNVDLRKREEILANKQYYSEIFVKIIFSKMIVDFFPEEDFCAYKDFPFHQLVFFQLYFDEKNTQSLSWRDSNKSEWTHKKITCKFRFLIKYHEYFNSIVNNFTYNRPNHSCDFESRLQLCKKSVTFKSSSLWGMADTLELNRIFQIILRISSLIISLIGIFTNAIVLVIISKEDNSDLFKQLDQYNYLSLISVFNIIILFIQLISWLSDYNAIIDIFCPDTRKLISIQFFKIIFKEALVVALRFMSNFSYMAFAFNRVALIGKDHPKLVEYMSKVNIKKYILLTTFISVILSIVKGFKYRINYEHPDLNYPFSIEYDLWFSKFTNTVGKSIYLVINFVSDFLNYAFFLTFNSIIDFYMLLRLRTTLNEKSKRITHLNHIVAGSVKDRKKNKNSNNKEVDINEAMNNAIKMVVWNSALNMALKCLLLLDPLINTITIFYYKSDAYKSGKQIGFDTFYNLFHRSGFSFILPIFADCLYTLLISIQLFVYVRFDKKIKTGFYRIFTRT